MSKATLIFKKLFIWFWYVTRIKDPLTRKTAPVVLNPEVQTGIQEDWVLQIPEDFLKISAYQKSKKKKNNPKNKQTKKKTKND